jgi:peptide/nickel transport system substrate-binding protein
MVGGLVGVGAVSAVASAPAGASSKIVTGGTASYSLLPGDVFTWVIPIESEVAYEPYQTNIEDSMYLPLYSFGKGSKTGVNYTLSIAEPPTWSDGDRTVTIDMKKTFTWSTGAPVTSNDVKMFFELFDVGKTTIGNYLPGLLPDNIASITYPNSYSFVLHLTKAFNPTWYEGNQLGWIYPLPVQSWDRTSPTSPASLSNSQTATGAKAVFTFMFSQAKDRNTYSTNPMWKVVDGPFYLSAYDPVTHAATFNRNTHYSGPTKPHLAAYRIYSFTTGTAEVNALRSGDITFGYLPYSDLPEESYFKGKGYKIKPWPIFYNNVMELSYTSKTWGPLVKQLYIRQALQHLITEKLYLTRTLKGNGLADYGPVAVYPGSSYVAPAIKKDPYPYDPKAAVALLTAHGWAKVAGGIDVCKRPGTGPSDCGKGIAKGRKLTLLTLYATGTTALFAQVTDFSAVAKSAGIDVKLDGQTVTTIYSLAGLCVTAQQKITKTVATGTCKWGMSLDALWFWNYGQYQLLPAGEDEFGLGNYYGGGYYTAKAQKLITAVETTTGKNDTKALYADEAYLAKQVPSLWWPLEDWEVAVVQKNLSGWQQLNAYANPMPQTWYFTGSS